MKLIWHIVRKDLRNLRWLLAGWPVILGLQVALGIWVREGAGGGFQAYEAISTTNSVLIGLELIMALVLTAAIVQEDSLVEPNAHWLILPVSGAQLLAAKLTALVLFIWLLPAILLWPWWLANHWGAADLFQSTLEMVLLHAVVTLPALLVAVMTNNWTRFLLWALAFVVALAMGFLLLYVQQSAPIETRLPETLSLSRLWAGLGVILVMVVAVVTIQYVTRQRIRSAACVGAAIIFGALILNFWPLDFVKRLSEALKPAPLPLAAVQLQLRSVSGSLLLPSHLVLRAEGSFSGLQPGESVRGRILEAEWRWANEVPRKWIYDNNTLGYFSSVTPDLSSQNTDQEPFPAQDALRDLGVASIASDMAVRMLSEPSEFTARAELAVRIREPLAEVPLQTGARFGHGADRFVIGEVMPSSMRVIFRLVEISPIFSWADWRQSWRGILYETDRSIASFNRTEQEIQTNPTRHLSQVKPQTLGQFGPFGGVSIDVSAYEIIPLRPVNPKWQDGLKVIWMQSRAVGRFESEISIPRFEVRDPIPPRRIPAVTPRANPPSPGR